MVLGLAEQARRDGGLRPAPGLRDALERLLADLGNAPATMETPRSSPSWLSVREAAEVARTPARTIRHLADTGRIRAVKIGWAWAIDADAARDYGRTRARGR